MTWRIKNWHKFQHFKDRRPPWIKLYRDILDDPDWHDLDGDDAKHLTMIWVIASEDTGALPDIRKLSFRLRMTETKTEQLLIRLSHWLYQDDINAISPRYHDDAPERERETEVEKEKESRSNEFERFWESYPRKVGKKVAEKALAKALRETSIDTIIEAVARQAPLWTEPKFIPHPATWLNAGRWADEGPELTPRVVVSDEEFARLRARHDEKMRQSL